MHVLADDALSVCDEFELYHIFFSQFLGFPYRFVLCVLRTVPPKLLYRTFELVVKTILLFLTKYIIT